MDVIINEGKNGRCEYLSSVSNFYIDPLNRMTLVFQGHGYQSRFDVAKVVMAKGFSTTDFIDITFRVFQHLCLHMASGLSSVVDVSSFVDMAYDEIIVESNVVSD